MATINPKVIRPAWVSKIRREANALRANEEHLHNQEMHRHILAQWRENSPQMWKRLEQVNLTDDLAMVLQARMWDRKKALMEGGLPVTDAREQAEREILMLEPEEATQQT